MMKFKQLATASLVLLVSACAERQIDILDNNGKVVGGCIAGYDWHFYGLQDSIDYMLYQCAKESIAAGYTITDMSLLDKDFTIPAPPSGQSWNKKLAMKQFKGGEITETKLGYVLAEIEFKYRLKVIAAEDELAAGKINKDKFEQLVSKAKLDWLGE